MGGPRFVHLRMHSEYSVSDGIVRLEEAVERAAADGMPALALTDSANLFGMVKFYGAARAAGIKPILGMEAYVTGVTGDTKHTDKVRENFHLVLLAENNTGYANLKKLSSTAFIDGKYYYPRVDRDPAEVVDESSALNRGRAHGVDPAAPGRTPQSRPNGASLGAAGCCFTRPRSSSAFCRCRWR